MGTVWRSGVFFFFFLGGGGGGGVCFFLVGFCGELTHTFLYIFFVGCGIFTFPNNIRTYNSVSNELRIIPGSVKHVYIHSQISNTQH